MNELSSLALELQAFCEQRDWRFCLIDGFALQHWGEPRFTQDVDMTLLTGFGNEEPFHLSPLRSSIFRAVPAPSVPRAARGNPVDRAYILAMILDPPPAQRVEM